MTWARSAIRAKIVIVMPPTYKKSSAHAASTSPMKSRKGPGSTGKISPAIPAIMANPAKTNRTIDPVSINRKYNLRKIHKFAV
jgi:hypothetical protein